MRDKSHARSVDAVIAVIAARQHGVVGHTQLVTLGLSRPGIQRRLDAGRLHRIHQGVYAVGHKRLTQRGRWMAAVLATGEDAVLSHRAAAALWKILPALGRIQVTTPRRLRPRDGIHPHSHKLQFDEVTTHDGIPTTTVARTLVDLAASDPIDLERAVNEAEYRRLADATGLADLLGRYPARRGAARLEAILESRLSGRTRSELEARFLALMDKANLPRPDLNADLELTPGRWIQPDCIWPHARLIVELDGRAAHETPSRFDADRERDRLLALAGWTVVRVTWSHLTMQPDALTADLRSLLATRG